MYVKRYERHNIRMEFFKDVFFEIEGEKFEQELDFTEETAHFTLATSELLLFMQYQKHCIFYRIILRLSCAPCRARLQFFP